MVDVKGIIKELRIYWYKMKMKWSPRGLGWMDDCMYGMEKVKRRLENFRR